MGGNARRKMGRAMMEKIVMIMKISFSISFHQMISYRDGIYIIGKEMIDLYGSPPYESF